MIASHADHHARPKRRILAASLFIAAPLTAQSTPDDFLVSVKYSKDVDSTSLTASMDLLRADTTRRGRAILALRTEFPGNGLSGTPAPISIALWYSNVTPSSDVNQFTFSLDGAPLTPLKAVSTCARSPDKYSAIAFGAVLSPSALHRLAAAKKLELTLGKEGFYATEDGLAASRAFAARVPADTDVAADSITFHASPLWEFQVERPTLARLGNPAPHSPGGQGEVLVQVEVDTSGQPVMPTFKVLKSTGPSFTEAVLAVLPQYRFQPAQACGHAVRQYAQLPFVFR